MEEASEQELQGLQMSSSGSSDSAATRGSCFDSDCRCSNATSSPEGAKQFFCGHVFIYDKLEGFFIAKSWFLYILGIYLSSTSTHSPDNKEPN